MFLQAPVGRMPPRSAFQRPGAQPTRGPATHLQDGAGAVLLVVVAPLLLARVRLSPTDGA